MVVIRTVDEIILSLIDFFKIAQPDADTKPGSVIRDLLIDAPANQLALLYDELSKVSIQQSLRLVSGSDLDKLAKNFGITRKTASPASGTALITFSSIPATISINAGDLVIATNGLAYRVLNGVSISPASANFYKSVATKFQNDLTFVGIQDQYAIEITVQATTAGIVGNISKYNLSRTTITSASNVTNASPFSGGNNQEDDATFRNRILSVFSGSSVGTALGYKNTALATTGVADAFVVEPGDPLMSRDGTITETDSEGNITIVSEGTGGKVDVVILGVTLTDNTDSFIYRDLSNNNDPTNEKNIVVLGQIAADAGKTITKKRIDDIKNGELPAQPVDTITQITGSLSGSNFKEKTIDSLGRVSGNYELIKDTGVYKGSPFGFDSLHWINNKVLFNEDRIKGQFNGQDALTFSDVLEIPSVQQNISITNENSSVLTSDRTLIQLLHTPANAVTRVFNVNTGERYTVVNQNPNGNGSLNTSGVIKISGNTLPTQSDVLQVDYNWLVVFDQYQDYDGRSLSNNLRSVTDSIDWGLSNQIKNENVRFTKDTSGNFFVGNTSLPISSIIAVSTFNESDASVTKITSGPFTGRLSVKINKLSTQTSTIDNVKWKNSNVELYNTSQNDGLFNNESIVVGINLLYNTTIILPSDTQAQEGNRVTVIFNLTDIYNIVNSTGSFSNNQVTVPTSNFLTNASAILFKVNYIANVQTLVNTGITSLPFSRAGNEYTLNNNAGFNNTYLSNLIRRENQIVQLNLSNQFYLEINLLSTDSTLNTSQVISIIRLSDGLELWNADNPGAITTNTSNNKYQLVLSGFNSPASGNNVLILYYATDNSRSQPFTFSNVIISKEFDSLQLDTVSKKFSVNIHKFVSETAVKFQIMEPNTDILLGSSLDGYLVSNGSSALFSNLTLNFSNVLGVDSKPIDLTSKKIKIYGSVNVNNNGIYDIVDYHSSTNVLTLSYNFSKISNNQISIIRIFDGKELWSDSGTIDVINNKLLFPQTSNASALDKIITIYFKVDNLKQSPTKLSLTLSDQVVNTGVISVQGTTIMKAHNIVFSTVSSNLKQNLLEAMRKVLSLNSSSNIPSNMKLVKIAKLQRVTTTNSASDDVIIEKSNYDLVGTNIKDNTFYGENFISNLSLGSFDFVLPSTINNTSNLNEQFQSGDKFRITFYYSTSNDLENVIFTRNGTLYTNKFFGLIDKVYVSSGFGVSQSARFLFSNFNQPITGSRYSATYNYLAPKQNERIIIQYNYNKLISDVTFNIENSRPINADILIREASAIGVDVSLNIVISSQFASSSTLIIQNVTDKIITAINSNGLGSTLEASNLITAAFSVEGVSGARIVNFNKSNTTGQVLRLKAQNDQYFTANTVSVKQETA